MPEITIIKIILRCCAEMISKVHWQITAEVVLHNMMLEGRIKEHNFRIVMAKIQDRTILDYDYLIKPLSVAGWN